MQPWDEDNLGAVALLTIVLQLAYFLLTYVLSVRKLSDIAAGTNFIVISLLSLSMAQTFYWRQIVVTGLVCLWGVRLSGYLVYRIIKIGQDERFNKHAKVSQIAGFWVFQAVWVYAVSLGVTFINSPTARLKPEGDIYGTPNDIVGTTIFLIGLAIETFADMQKFFFKENPQNKDRWCTFGLWRWSRHPNYFGEILLWWGIFIIGSSTYTDYQWAAVISPTFTSAILLFLSGIPLLEKKSDDRYSDLEDYIDYKHNTSVLIPIPPCLYRRIPKYLHIVCLDLPIYDFTEVDPLLPGPAFV